MVATVRVGGGCSEPIQVRNGLWQGCVVAPVLLNLYFAVVLERFHELLSRLQPKSGVGLHVKYQREFVSSLNSSLADL